MNARTVLLVAMCTILQACSGGASSTAPSIAPTASGTAPRADASVSLTIAIPKATTSSTARGRYYVSAATQSIVVQQLSLTAPYKPVGSPVVANVSASSPGCSTNAIQTTCVLTFTALPGTFNFSIQTYSGANGGGSLLAENAITSATIVIGVANMLSVTLDGVVASLVLPNSISATSSSPEIVTFTVEDAAGAEIIGNGIYDNGPITVTDPSGLVSLSPASFAAPSAASSFTMQCQGGGSGALQFADASGALGSLGYTCTLNMVTLKPGSLDFDAVAAGPSDPTYDQAVSVTDQNSNVASQSPELSCTGGQGSAGGAIASVSSPSSEMWAIRPLDVGTCTFSVVDQLGDGSSVSSQTIAIEIHMTAYTISGRKRGGMR